MKLSECSNLPHGQQVETRATEQGSGGNALLHYLRWAPSVVVVAVMAGFSADLAPAMRLLLAALVLYGCFKFAAIAKQQGLWATLRPEARFWYLTAWPGMDLKPFAPGARPKQAPAAWLGRGALCMALGAALLALPSPSTSATGLADGSASHRCCYSCTSVGPTSCRGRYANEASQYVACSTRPSNHAA